jgi:serine/threonine protein kinase
MNQEVSDSKIMELCPTCGAAYPLGTGTCTLDGITLVPQLPDPLIGKILPRRYRILAPLGKGSMSVVYKGVYEPLEQIVAIKMLKTHLVADETQAKRFQHEIKAAGALIHPNIVGILDFGVTEEGVPYLIMEYLEGKNLAALIRQQERLSVPTAIHIFSQVADALAFAHEHGIVHRDVKPSNIVIMGGEDDEKNVKLVDFGIAKVKHAASAAGDNPALTRAGEVLGTPLYMSPEQCQGKELDGRSDIYSLGCVMYASLTGQPPIVGDHPMDTIKKQVTMVPPPMEKVRPDLFFPEKLTAVVNKALIKDPRLRYQYMAQLKEDLDASERSDTGANPSGVSTAIVPSGAKASSSQPFNLFFICGAVAVAAVLGTVGWVLFHKEPNQVAAVAHILPGGDESAWKKLSSDAQDAYTAGRYEQAGELCQSEVTEARRFKQPDARLAASLNTLASVQYQQDKLDAAEQSAQEALSIQQKISSADPAFAEIISNLSRIRCAMGKFDSAQALAQQTLKMTTGNTVVSTAALSQSLQTLADIECAGGNYESARQYLERARSITGKASGEENADYAKILNDLGIVLEREKKYKPAESLFNTALGTRQKVLGLEHPAVADTQCALGTLYFNMHNDAAAENDFNSALKIRQQVFGPGSSRVAEVYSCLGILYSGQGKLPEAEECFRKAFEIREKLWGRDNPRLVNSMQQLADCLRRQGRKEGAQAYDAQIKRIRSGKSKSKVHTIFD